MKKEKKICFEYWVKKEVNLTREEVQEAYEETISYWKMEKGEKIFINDLLQSARRIRLAEGKGIDDFPESCQSEADDENEYGLDELLNY